MTAMTAKTARPVLVALICLWLAGCGGPAAPWPAEPQTMLDLRLQVQPTTVQLLEPVTVTLDLWRRQDRAVEFAPQVDRKDFQSSLTVEPERPLHGGLWQRSVLVLKPLRGPGELVLPPFVASEKDGAGAASTPETKIVVATALTAAGPGIEAPGEPFPPRLSGWWFVAGGTLPLLLAALWSWLRHRRRQPHQPLEVALPPHTKAQRALQRLRTADRTTRAQIDTWYVEVSAVLRVYLEERFGLRAPERTTEEFLRELESGDQLAKDHRRELERFLSQCDLVKFAGLVPTENDHLATWSLAVAFVDATRADRTAEASASPPQPPQRPAEVPA